MKAPAKPRLPKDLGPDGPRLLEEDVEKKVCEYAVRRGWVADKFNSPARRAKPDRLCINPFGQVLFIEFKRPGEKMTNAQIDEAKRLQGRRQWVYCVAGVGIGKALIDVWSNRDWNQGRGRPNPLITAEAPRVLEDSDL